ncbi:hypothetical protein CYMTET_8167, partial [Cymbomonas tetramitiformis]
VEGPAAYKVLVVFCGGGAIADRTEVMDAVIRMSDTPMTLLLVGALNSPLVSYSDWLGLDRSRRPLMAVSTNGKSTAASRNAVHTAVMPTVGSLVGMQSRSSLVEGLVTAVMLDVEEWYNCAAPQEGAGGPSPAVAPSGEVGNEASQKLRAGDIKATNVAAQSETSTTKPSTPAPALPSPSPPAPEPSAQAVPTPRDAPVPPGPPPPPPPPPPPAPEAEPSAPSPPGPSTASTPKSTPAAPVPPPPPPPPAPPPSLNSTGTEDTTAGAKSSTADLMSAIRRGSQLKPAEVPDSPPEPAVGDLMAAIRKGSQLKHVEAGSGSPTGLVDEANDSDDNKSALIAAIQHHRQLLRCESGLNTGGIDSDQSDDDW